MKTYEILVDIRWSQEFIIKAKNKTEAKQKAIDRFRKNKSNFRADAEEVESGKWN